MALQEINFSKMLAHWKQYTEGDKLIFGEKPNSSQLSIQNAQENAQKIALKALQDLSKIKEDFQLQLKDSKLNKTSICEVCELTNTIERIVQFISNTSLYGKNLLDSQLVDDSLSNLMEVSAFVSNSVQEIDIKELQPQFAIDQLKLFSPNTSALDALIGNQGLLSKDVLTRTLGIITKEVMERCFVNAKLISVQDLMDLFKEKMENERNIVKIVKNHLEKSREEARTKMGPETRDAFDIQWNKPGEKDFMYEGKITPRPSFHEQEKIEAWDFLKQTSFAMELKNLSKEEKILKYTRLFKSDKGDFYLKIDNIGASDSVKKMLGNENFTKLNEINSCLWSPDSISFYLMERLGMYTFETEEGSQDSRVSMDANELYASLKDKNEQTLATYNRQSLESIRQLFASLKSGEAQLIPLSRARKPLHLFQMENGQYIYVNSTYADNDFEVYIGSNGNYQKQQVSESKRSKDGSTTYITLTNGCTIFSPAPFDNSKPPMYTKPGSFLSSDKKYELRRLNHGEFDYKTIGIELESMNPRHTMLDFYQ